MKFRSEEPRFLIIRGSLAGIILAIFGPAAISGAIRIDGARIVTALGIAARIRPFESSANRSAERVL